MTEYAKVDNCFYKSVPIIGPSDYKNYQKMKEIAETYDKINLIDHLNGIEKSGKNQILRLIDTISSQKSKKITVYAAASYYKFCGHDIQSLYPNLNFIDNFMLQTYRYVSPLFNFNMHSPIDIKNFLISLNGSPHISRKLLVSALYKMNMFNPKYSTKNFKYTQDELDGHIQELCEDSESFYTIFFSYSDIFFNNSIYTDNYTRYEHEKNIKYLSQKFSESFVHLVSETMATNDACISEKSFYSIVNRGLFVIYGGVNTNKFMSAAFGFKPYNNIFDYSFDAIENPLDRLIALLTMLKKFSDLSLDDWNNLYLLEQDNIEYNYENFFNRNFIKNYYNFCEEMFN